jgi:GGDEF domain-containing protein
MRGVALFKEAHVSDLEIALWSACLGVYFSYACLSLFYALYNRAFLGRQTVLFVLFWGAFVALGSGLAAALINDISPAVENRLVMASCALAASYSAMGLRKFLRAEQRDALVDRGFLFVAMVCALLLLAQAWPDQLQAMVAVAMIAVGASVMAFWLSLRAWLLGDRFALPMAVACAAMIFAVLGLFATALGAIDHNMPLQTAAAICAGVYVVVVCHTMKRRHAEHRKMKQALAASRDKDLLTHLWTGAVFIRSVDEAIARARRNRKEMAVICVEIYNTGHLRQEFGQSGLEQVIYGMAARIRMLAGSSVVVGRYSDTSFMVVLDSVKQTVFLRTLGLRLAVGVRRPYTLDAFSSEQREFKAEVGVGIARVASGREKTQRVINTMQGGEFDSFSMAQDVLHEAAELAIASKRFNSRAAIMDGYSRKAIALEDAELG